MREDTLLLVAGIFWRLIAIISRIQRLGGATLWLLGWVVLRWRVTVAGHQFAHGISFAWLRINCRIVRAVLDQGQQADLLALAFLPEYDREHSIAVPIGRQH